MEHHGGMHDPFERRVAGETSLDEGLNLTGICYITRLDVDNSSHHLCFINKLLYPGRNAAASREKYYSCRPVLYHPSGYASPDPTSPSDDDIGRVCVQ